MGFTDLLFRLPSSKAPSTSHYDDEFLVALNDKIQKILINRPNSNSVVVNTVNRPAVAVNTYTLVISNIPSRVENSSDVIGQELSNSYLVSFNLMIIVAFISCITRSIKICDHSHTWTENCLPIDNSKFNFKSITFSDKVLLHFILENRQLLPYSKKRSNFPMDKLTELLLIIPEERNIALKFRDDRLPTEHANLVMRYKSDLNLPQSPILPGIHRSKTLLQRNFSSPTNSRCRNNSNLIY